MAATDILERFHACQGSLELFSLEGAAALELLRSNPLAGFCLAVNWVFHKPVIHWPLAVARHYMRKPQREILGWLGFRPAIEAVAKIGRKCLPESLTIERSLHLRRVLTDARTRELLAQLPCVNAEVIGLIASRELLAAITPQLLQTVARQADEIDREETARLLKDTLKMRSMLRRKDPPPPFRSQRRLQEQHDHLLVELNNRGLSGVGGGPFPPPLIPGYCRPREQIVPIRNPQALQALAREQHNCVAAYKDRISGGALCVYRVVVGDEVSTLSLCLSPSRGCVIDQLQTTYNEPVSPITKFVVDRWFRAGCYGRTMTPRRPPKRRQPLPAAPLAGGTSAGVEISPIPDRAALAELLADETAADYCLHRARGGREHYYQAVAAGVCFLVSIEHSPKGFRFKELRRPDRGRITGNVLAALADWLGRAQGKYR